MNEAFLSSRSFYALKKKFFEAPPPLVVNVNIQEGSCGGGGGPF